MSINRVVITGNLTRDPELRSTGSGMSVLKMRMAVNDRLPTVGIVVTVAEVFLHCAKAFRRARLWDTAARQDRTEMPSLLKMILDQTTGAPTDPAEMQKIDDGLEADYRTSMY